MPELRPKEMLKNQSLQKLSFLRGKNWLVDFKNRLSKDVGKENFFAQSLVPAGTGIAECMDERPSLKKDQLDSNYFSAREIKHPKPAMVGGAAGWTTYFLLIGQNIDQAIESTKTLYEKMNWGEMQVHIDDEHGAINIPKELKNRKKGCGFLGVVNEVVSITEELLKGEEIVGENISQINSEEIMNKLIEKGAKVVVLSGNHKNKNYEAQVVINDKEDKTLSRDSLYDENPVFLWDKWATTNQAVLAIFNNLADKDLSQEQFIKLQATVHLATGLMLDAIKLGEDGNVLMP